MSATKCSDPRLPPGRTGIFAARYPFVQGKFTTTFELGVMARRVIGGIVSPCMHNSIVF